MSIIVKEERVLIDDKTVEETIVRRKPRYSVRVSSDEYGIESKSDFEGVMDECYIYTPSREFSNLNNTDFVGEELSCKDDYEVFCEYIKTKYGKEYEVSFLMKYEHGGVKFYESSERTKVCNFDSGILGFIARKPEDTSFKVLCEILTDAWNGDYTLYEVYDEYEEETVDCLTYCGRMSYLDFVKAKSELEERYDVIIED